MSDRTCDTAILDEGHEMAMKRMSGSIGNYDDGRGNVTSTRVPDPGVLDSAIVPPCASTMARAIVSPSPAPPVPRDRPESTR